MNRKLCGKSIVFILYDSVLNSVFYSQVAMPLKKLLQENKESTLTIVSFEKKNVSKELVRKIEKQIDSHRCKLIIRKKMPLVGKIALWPCVFLLIRLLKCIAPSDMIARGPFAGWIALKSMRWLSKDICVIVQARGLAAEEFRYTNKTRLVKKYFYNLYKRIEHEVYKKKDQLAIETVSPALKEYLINNFDADASHVSVSCYDIPDKIDQSQVKEWRKQVRAELGIAPDAYVYCYLGSAHLWQCVDQMVSYASETCKKDKKAFFLFLSEEKEVFEHKLQKASVPRDRYIIRSIDPAETFKYLSVADAGLLFREKDPVNWVSRPTKMLEYQSVGLRLVHNNTVAWLT